MTKPRTELYFTCRPKERIVSLSLFVAQTRFTYSFCLGISNQGGLWLTAGRGHLIGTADPHLSITSLVPFRRDGGKRCFNVQVGKEFA